MRWVYRVGVWLTGAFIAVLCVVGLAAVSVVLAAERTVRRVRLGASRQAGAGPGRPR